MRSLSAAVPTTRGGNQREDVKDRVAGLDADGYHMDQRVAVLAENEHGVVVANDQQRGAQKMKLENLRM
jgi:hypothetical protein